MSYIEPSDLYSELVDEDEFVSTFVQARIDACQRIIENQTGTFFEPTDKTYYLDGNGDDEILLPAPILSINSIQFKTGGAFSSPINLSSFEIYNDYESRRNPLIAIGDDGIGNIDAFFSKGLFPEGRRNIKIFGSFGYLDQNNETPADIKLALKLLVVDFLENVGDQELQRRLNMRGIKRFKNDKQEVETHADHAYGVFTGNREADLLIGPYKRTWGSGLA